MIYLKPRISREDGGRRLLNNYQVRETDSSYLGQLVEWPEVLTEDRTLEERREMLRYALREMILAHCEQGKEIPPGGTALVEQISAEA